VQILSDISSETKRGKSFGEASTYVVAALEIYILPPHPQSNFGEFEGV